MMMIACSSKKRKTNNPSIRGKNLFRPLGGIINDVKLFNGRLKEYLPNTIQSSND
jgi:hypothetical protein